MKKIFTENIGLKFLSVGLAFALWLIVVNYDDPVISATYNGIKVDIINTDTLTTKGKIYDVMNDSDNISVTVTGKRSVVESLTKDNIIATADVSNLTLMDTVAIDVSTNKNYEQLDSVKSDTATVELSIEDLITRHLPLSVEVTGEPAEGYIVGDVSTNQNTISISGPKSVVDSVEKAEISVNVVERTSDITTTATVFLYNASDNVVTAPNMSLNIYTINVSVGVLPTKAVDIVYDYSGTPAEGYAVNGSPRADRRAVFIAGKNNVLERVSVIEVPENIISVEGKSESFEQTVDLSRFLPDGIRFADPAYKGNVNVNMIIEPVVEKEISIPMRNIKLINIPEGYSASLFVRNDDITEKPEEEQIMIKVGTKGIAEYYEGYDSTTLQGIIDVNENLVSAGKYTADEAIYQMEIKYDLPNGIELTDKCFAEVMLVVKRDTGDETDN